MSKVLVKRGKGGNECHRRQKSAKNHKAQCSPEPRPSSRNPLWPPLGDRNPEKLRTEPLLSQGRCMDGKGEPELISKIRHFWKQSDCLHTYKGECIYNGEFCPLNKAKFPNLRRIFAIQRYTLKRGTEEKWGNTGLNSSCLEREGSSENRQNENKSQKMGIKDSNEFKLHSCSGTDKNRQEAQPSWW